MKAYLFLLAIFLVGCNSNEKSSSEKGNTASDRGLRFFFGVSSLSGSFKVPAGSHSYIVTTLEFEDGKQIRRGGANSGIGDSGKDEIVNAEILWGKVDGTPRTVVVTPGASATAEDIFWSGFGVTHPFEAGSNPEYDGYIILGMGQSDESRSGIGPTAFGPDLALALKEKKRVGLLVARIFKTTEEREKFLESYP